MVFYIVLNQEYLQKELPMAGYTRMTPRLSECTEMPSYCYGSSVSGCLFLNADRVVNRFHSFVITTRITIEEYGVSDPNGYIQQLKTRGCTPAITGETDFDTEYVKRYDVDVSVYMRGDGTGLTLGNRDVDND